MLMGASLSLPGAALAGRGGAGVPSVESLSPVIWYDVSDLSTLFEDRAGTTPASVDGLVGMMHDLSGNDHHAVAVSDPARPTLRQSGSSYWLEFSSVHRMKTGALSVTAPRTTIVSFRFDAAADFIIDGDVNNQNSLYAISTTTLRFLAAAAGGVSWTTATAGTDLALGLLANGASSAIYDSGGTLATGNAGSLEMTAFTLGASGGGAGPLAGRIYGAAVFGGDLAANERAGALAWAEGLF